MNTPSPKTNILVVGIYWSGSGAVVDFLKGHPQCFTPSGEFTDIKREGRVISAVTATSATRARHFIRLMWLETVIGKLPPAFVQRLAGKNQDELPLKKQWRHIQLKLKALQRCRDHIRNGGNHTDTAPWRQWIREMGDVYAPDRQAVVWNQPLWVGSHEQIALDIFSPGKLIVVHRDPEDQFAEVERQGKLGKAKSDPAFSGDRSEPVTFVLDGITRKLESLVSLKNSLPANDILTLPFESFVIDHEAAERRVCEFVGLQKTLDSGPYFHPEQSRKNVGIGQATHIQSMLSPYRDKIQRMTELRKQLD